MIQCVETLCNSMKTLGRKRMIFQANTTNLALCKVFCPCKPNIISQNKDTLLESMLNKTQLSANTRFEYIYRKLDPLICGGSELIRIVSRRSAHKRLYLDKYGLG